jgi:hypothetical protein
VNYDLIGDIHGHATELEALLARLGYARDGTTWVPPAGTTTVFLGDFIDRGPQNRRVLEIVRGMLAGGHALAVMGNHEVNAIAFSTPDPRRPGEYLRPHRPEKVGGHATFLAEYRDRPADHAEVVEFFLTLPLVLELPGADLRVVHACWSPRHVQLLREHPLAAGGDRITREFLVEAREHGSPAHQVIETLLKGPEVPLAADFHFPIEGSVRRKARYRWWASGPADAPARRLLPWDRPMPLAPIDPPSVPDVPSPDGVPVFFGHYWMRPDDGPPPVAPNWACLDLSVARGGALAAYRWRAEDRGRPLSPDRLVTVGARS